MVLLTQSGGWLGPIAKVLGWIFNGLFEFTGKFGVQNVGLSIILFTIVIKLLMLPLTIKQMKFSKLSMIMNPELQAIQKKYQGKTDQDSLARMQDEQKAIYEKYGTSPTGGCLQLLIQMPILFALYRVIQNVPAYVTSVKSLFENMIISKNGLMAQADFARIMTENFKEGDYTTVNGIIDVINSFNAEQWEQLKSLFPASANLIADNVSKLNHMYNFFGINLAVAPVIASIGILIPILTALTQWISMKTIGNNNPAGNDDNPAAQSMKTMNTIMPIMTGFIAVSLPAGLGLYWIATAVCQTVQQLALNMYFDQIDLNELVQKNIEKSNEKRARKGLPANNISTKVNANSRLKENERMANRAQEIQNKLEETKKRNLEKVEEIRNASNNTGKKKSLSERANMVSNYNDKNK